MDTRWVKMPFTTLLCLSVAGCVRRDGRNTDCRWPGETPVQSANARHLSADAEFAEDLAIRYADAHHGLQSPDFVSLEVYGAERQRCLGSLFEQVAKQHDVPVASVSAVLGRNRTGVDLAEVLPFLLLYCIAVAAVARLIWRKYPRAEDGWMAGTAMAVFLSLVMAAGGMMLGEQGIGLAETWRVGNGHMSYRGQRLWWPQHRPEIFAGAWLVFFLATAAAAPRATSNDLAVAESTPPPPAR